MVFAPAEVKQTFPALVTDRAPGVGYTPSRWLEARPVIPDDDWLAVAFGAASGPSLRGRYPRPRAVS